MKFSWIGLVLCYLSFWPSAASQTADSSDFLLQVRNSEGEVFRQQIQLLYDSVSHVADYQSKMKLAGQLFALTEKKDEIAHFHSLLFLAMHSGKMETDLFEQAYEIAEKHQRIDDINNVEFRRARFYLAKKQYDSAMIYLLRYRDMTPPDIRGEGYRNIINLMGDIYYNAGIFSKAAEVYQELLQQYIVEDNWNYFRPYVMMNNLGQIAMKQNDLHEARKWFNKSLKLADRNLHTSYRYNTLGYTKIKLAETALLSDSLTTAWQRLNEVAAYPADDIYEDVRQEYLYIKARLLLMQGKPNDALSLAKQLVPDDSLRFSEYRFIPEIYSLFADIFVKRGDYPLALQYSDRFNKIEDSLQSQKHFAGSLIILAEYNQELTRLELQRSGQRIVLLGSGLIVLLAILVVVLLLYRKLYFSKLELVRKSLENELTDTMPTPENGNSTLTDMANEDELIQHKQLIKQLKIVMEKQKPFLDPGLTIAHMAGQLNTNRTYLSKAINKQLKTTFPNFINQHRIKEAIRLIISGYTANRTQEALARKSGFANRNVFIKAFKKYTGVLPSFFIANYKKWDQQKNRFNHDD